jgi:diacylglycerol kinase family enzyme
MAVGERWGILYCPKKGLGRHRKHWERIQHELDSRGVLYDMVQSESSDSVERLVTMLIHNGYKTIIIVGGDSALNDAVNCLMREDKEVRESISLGVIPNGMLNDFARFWGFAEREDAQTVDWLQKQRMRKVDLGCITYKDADGNDVKRYFLNCINIGLIADIMNLRRQARQLLGSVKLAFLSSLVVMIFHRHDYKMRLNINFETIDRRVMTVCIGNALGYGQTPNAVPYSGMLDVSVVYNPKVKQLLNGLWLLVTGRLLNHRSVHPYRTRKLEVEDAKKARIGIDGRLWETPAESFSVHVLPEMINFLIPD